MQEEPKQVIVVRNDLRSKLRHGKLAVQVAHASQAAFNLGSTIDRLPNGEKVFTVPLSDPHKEEWIVNLFAKIILRCDDEEELLKIADMAKSVGLPVAVITDAGRTVFREPTTTCIGIGPTVDSKLKGITDHLKMY